MMKVDAIVGAKVKSNRVFSGVPEGTLGVVDEDYGSGVWVKWRRYPGDFLRDGFDKGSELQFLDLV